MSELKSRDYVILIPKMQSFSIWNVDDDYFYSKPDELIENKIIVPLLI